MNIKLKIWRQKNRDSKGYFETYSMSDIEEQDRKSTRLNSSHP